MDYEIIVFAGDSGDDVHYFQGGDTLEKALPIFKEAIAKFPYRDIELRESPNQWDTTNYKTPYTYQKQINSVQLITEEE
jgi:hypothetical protein